MASAVLSWAEPYVGVMGLGQRSYIQPLLLGTAGPSRSEACDLPRRSRVLRAGRGKRDTRPSVNTRPTTGPGAGCEPLSDALLPLPALQTFGLQDPVSCCAGQQGGAAAAAGGLVRPPVTQPRISALLFSAPTLTPSRAHLRVKG